MKHLAALTLALASACTPTAPATLSAPPSSSTEPASAPARIPPPTAPAGSPSPTRIPASLGGVLAAASGGVVWMYVAGEHLFVSLNHGDTWTERNLPADAYRGSLAFISAGEGWWLMFPVASQGDCQSVRLWKTDDEAVTWRRLDAAGLDTAGCKGTIQFSGPGVGFLPVADPDGPSAIYRTVDGGWTWTRSNTLADPPGVVSRPGARLQIGNIGDFGSVLFADAYVSDGGALRHFAYRSTDRGATWTYAWPALQTSAITFLTATRWLQLMDDGDSRESVDGGRSWHFYPSSYRPLAPVAAQVVFGDGETGYATVRSLVLRSTDGGAHWSSLPIPGT